jgi:hypothetical protein
MQPSEIATLISGFRKAGVAEAEIKAAIEGDGYTWPGDELKEQPKQPTEAQEFDTSSLAPNADPASYNINWFANKPTITPELTTALGAEGLQAQPKPDAALREGLASMGIPASAGGSIAELMMDSARQFAGLSPSDKQAARERAKQGVAAALGEDAVGQYQAIAKQWATKNPTMFRALTESDYLSSPVILGQLALQARRNAARKELK